MEKIFYCIVSALFLLCSCKSYRYNGNRSFLLTTGKEKHISKVSLLLRSTGPKRGNRFGEAFGKVSEEVMLKADSILRNKYPQLYEKGKDRKACPKACDPAFMKG